MQRYKISINGRRQLSFPVMGKWYYLWLDDDRPKRLGQYRYMGADMWSDGVNGAAQDLPEFDYMTLA